MSERRLEGIVCPECGRPMDKTTDSRKQRGYVRRRRQCLHCGHRVSTIEVRAGRFYRTCERAALYGRLIDTMRTSIEDHDRKRARRMTRRNVQAVIAATDDARTEIAAPTEPVAEQREA